MNKQATIGKSKHITLGVHPYSLDVLSAKIEISANSRISCGYAVDVKITGVFARCRKVAIVSYSAMGGYIGARPLFGSNGEAKIEPSQWIDFLRSLPIVSADLFPIEISEQLKQDVLALLEGICDGARRMAESDRRFRISMWSEKKNAELEQGLAKSFGFPLI